MIRICVLLLALIATALAVEPVLMGYTRIDERGLPEEVRVALTRARFTALWAAAHPEAIATKPTVDLATGAITWQLEADPLGTHTVQAIIRLPVAVLADDWRQVRLPVPVGSVASISLEALGSAPIPGPERLSWVGAEGLLVVNLAGHTQGIVAVRLSLPLAGEAGRWRTDLPLQPGGGTLDLVLPAGWEPVPGPLAFRAGTTGHFTADSLADGGDVTLELRRIETLLPRDLRLSLDQSLSLRLRDDRLDWFAEVAIAVHGGTVRDLRLDLPLGLLVTTVTGDGLSAWRQEGAGLHLTWSSALGGSLRLQATGVIPRTAAMGEADLAVRLAGADQIQGRLGLITDGGQGNRGERLATVEDPRLLRSDPSGEEDLAVRWNDADAVVRIRWEPVANDLHVRLEGAVVAAADQVQARVRATLSGRGPGDVLRLRLPEPWRVGSALCRPGAQSDDQLPHLASETGLHSVVLATGEDGRWLIVRGDVPLVAGAILELELVAERRALGADFDLPDLWSGDGIITDRQEWVIGDRGASRLRIDAAGNLGNLSVDSLARRFADLLPAGGLWRQAVDRRTGPAAHARLESEEAQATVEASHYLILETERLRWSARLVFTPVRGALTVVGCSLPPGVRILRASCRDLGDLTVTEGHVLARLAASSLDPVALELDLELPLDASSAQTGIRITALIPEAGARLTRQQVALVEDFDIGLVHRDLDGLVDQDRLALALPTGIEADRIHLHWAAQRPDWSLTLRREALVPAGGLDGIATLVDAYAAIAPDGELRGRATWHLLIRNEQQVRLDIPVGLELWEVRVDGRSVSSRQDASDPAAVWVPVRPLRTGEAARRVEVTWRQAPPPDPRRLTPRMPRFAGVKVVQCLWRFSAPAGWTLSRHDGALRETDDVEASSERVRRVIEDVGRLRAQGDLKDSALQRSNAELERLSLELDDHLTQLRAAGAPASEGLTSQLQRLREDRDSNDRLLRERASGRKALGIGERSMAWTQAEATSAPALSLSTQLPWREPLMVDRRGGLGDGEAPPGHRTDGERGLLGIDLVGEAPPSLVLRGSGDDFTVELDVRPPAAPLWPSLLAGLLAVVLVGLAGLVSRRRA